MSVWKLKGVDDGLEDLLIDSDLTSDNSLERLAHAADHLEGVVDYLFGRKDFNKSELYGHLEEVACVLNVKLPEQETMNGWRE